MYQGEEWINNPLPRRGADQISYTTAIGVDHVSYTKAIGVDHVSCTKAGLRPLYQG